MTGRWTRDLRAWMKGVSRKEDDAEGRRWREEERPPRWPEWRIKRWERSRRRRWRSNRRSGASQHARWLWWWGNSTERVWAVWYWEGEVGLELERWDYLAEMENLARRRRRGGGRSWAMLWCGGEPTLGE